MGTTSEELKKLYAKLGGKDPKVAGFSAPGEILNAINEIPLPTEYELPTVTTEDAGDVLVVNEEGHWDKGEASGGLPEVTTDDNGDILQVVEGAWGKAKPQNISVYKGREQISGDWITVILNDGKKTSDLTADFDNGKVVFVITDSHTMFMSNKYKYVGITSYTLSSIGYEIPTGGTQAKLHEYHANINSGNNDSFLLQKNRIALYSDIPTT